MQAITAFGFEMTDPELRQSIRRYLSIYENIDENIVDRFVELVNRHSDLFHHLAEIETDPEFLPYVKKYSELKMQFIDQPIDPHVQITFSENTLEPATTFCDPLTRIIFIDRILWNQFEDNETLKKTIVFHALGHCDLNRDDISPSSEVASFMNTAVWPPLLVAENSLEELFETMYQELFSRENTRENHCDISEDVCINQHLEYFENRAFNTFGVGIPMLKYMTIDSELEQLQ